MTEDISEMELRKFQSDPSGIRNCISMNRVCLACGSKKVLSRTPELHYYRYCRDCGADYYRNICWNCLTTVDSRDPQNPYCTVCGWLKCTCRACSKYGCSTNEYSRSNRLRDRLPENMDVSVRPSSCPECGGDGYAQDGGQCDRCFGSGDYCSDYSCDGDEYEDDYDEDENFEDENRMKKDFSAPEPEETGSTPTNSLPQF